MSYRQEIVGGYFLLACPVYKLTIRMLSVYACLLPVNSDGSPMVYPIYDIYSESASSRECTGTQFVHINCMPRTYSLTKVSNIRFISQQFHLLRHGIKTGRKQKLKLKIGNALVNKTMSICFLILIHMCTTSCI